MWALHDRMMTNSIEYIYKIRYSYTWNSRTRTTGTLQNLPEISWFAGVFCCFCELNSCMQTSLFQVLKFILKFTCEQGIVVVAHQKTHSQLLEQLCANSPCELPHPCGAVQALIKFLPLSLRRQACQHKMETMLITAAQRCTCPLAWANPGVRK